MSQREQTGAPPPPGRPFANKSWQTIVQILARDLEGLDYYNSFRYAEAVQDTADTLVLQALIPADMSNMSRHHADAIYRALALVGRPRTVVRVRLDIAPRGDKPDYVYRTLPPPNTRSRRPSGTEESETLGA